uniref:Uncharacterized protein n=1 Tax=Leersia perrieri TaxID=77586 RepID=A0A0D9WFQ6_9ORYZ
MALMSYFIVVMLISNCLGFIAMPFAQVVGFGSSSSIDEIDGKKGSSFGGLYQIYVAGDGKRKVPTGPNPIHHHLPPTQAPSPPSDKMASMSYFIVAMLISNCLGFIATPNAQVLRSSSSLGVEEIGSSSGGLYQLHNHGTHPGPSDPLGPPSDVINFGKRVFSVKIDLPAGHGTHPGPSDPLGPPGSQIDLPTGHGTHSGPSDPLGPPGSQIGLPTGHGTHPGPSDPLGPPSGQTDFPTGHGTHPGPSDPLGPPNGQIDLPTGHGTHLGPSDPLGPPSGQIDLPTSHGTHSGPSDPLGPPGSQVNLPTGHGTHPGPSDPLGPPIAHIDIGWPWN